MPARVSAGLVLYRIAEGRLEVLLAHPGGPLFARKDAGHWTIPKGEIQPHEDPLAAAIRELEEETGIAVDPRSRFIDLGSIRQKGGKLVHAFGVASDWDDSRPIRSNSFELEWPPRSGRRERFPEVDRVRFYPLPLAREKIKPAQIPLLERLAHALA
jgi:predicted NUDIX family NTP pyrophosphohydrolase